MTKKITTTARDITEMSTEAQISYFCEIKRHIAVLKELEKEVSASLNAALAPGRHIGNGGDFVCKTEPYTKRTLNSAKAREYLTSEQVTACTVVTQVASYIK